ncbi:hypothetical protein [Marinifilum sp. N1E240]|nr:hypothetical protein [Marinifilum sp. N1E240]
MNDVKEFLSSQSFEMIKELEKEEPLTVKLLNRQSLGKYIQDLH